MRWNLGGCPEASSGSGRNQPGQATRSATKEAGKYLLYAHRATVANNMRPELWMRCTIDLFDLPP